jgi:hypothetical protein
MEINNNKKDNNSNKKDNNINKKDNNINKKDNEIVTEYKKNIDDLNKMYLLSLDEVVKTEPKYKTFPQIKGYQDEYKPSIDKYKDIQNSLSALYNNLGAVNNADEETIKKLLTNIQYIKEQIEIKTNKTCNNFTSEMLLTDTRLLRNQLYIGNCILVILVIFLSVQVYRRWR